jgi:hypothetical protein
MHRRRQRRREGARWVYRSRHGVVHNAEAALVQRHVGWEGLFQFVLQQPTSAGFGRVAFAAKLVGVTLYQGFDALVAHVVEALSHAAILSFGDGGLATRLAA